jgi:hypothetical protein
LNRPGVANWPDINEEQLANTLSERRKKYQESRKAGSLSGRKKSFGSGKYVYNGKKYRDKP